MSKPTIVAVDDDPVVAAAITRDLRSRYSNYHQVVRATSGREALEVLASLALRDQPVALIVTDQRMPEMTGIEMLGQARTHAPGAKYLLLTAYADTDVAIRAINDIGLDYYLLKPWDPPEELLYPVIDDLLGDWRQANPDHTSEVRVGTEWLGPDVARDGKGFVVTGRDLFSPGFATQWPLARAPFALETSVPGVFAAGDVRLDSMKRVASAVGEGAMSVYFVHRYLATV
jgi:thioredoxin reductase (NADPH)